MIRPEESEEDRKLRREMLEYALGEHANIVAEFDLDEGDDDESEASALKAREPISGAQVCKAACAVTCNSTVLALRQKWCLEKCVSIPIRTIFCSIRR